MFEFARVLICFICALPSWLYSFSWRLQCINTTRWNTSAILRKHFHILLELHKSSCTEWSRVSLSEILAHNSSRDFPDKNQKQTGKNLPERQPPFLESWHRLPMFLCTMFKLTLTVVLMPPLSLSGYIETIQVQEITQPRTMSLYFIFCIQRQICIKTIF